MVRKVTAIFSGSPFSPSYTTHKRASADPDPDTPRRRPREAHSSQVKATQVKASQDKRAAAEHTARGRGGGPPSERGPFLPPTSLVAERARFDPVPWFIGRLPRRRCRCAMC